MSQRPQLPNTDFGNASKANRPSRVLERKWFKVQKKGSLQLMTVNIDAANAETAFEKICNKVKVDPVGASVVFPLRTSSKGDHDDIVIENDADVKESLMTFFVQCEEGSKLIVVPRNIPIKKTRDYRPTEYGYNTIVGPSFVVNRHFYEYLQENDNIHSQQISAKTGLFESSFGPGVPQFSQSGAFLLSDPWLLKKAYLLSKSVPRQTNRTKWREKSGYQPNMLLAKECPGMIYVGDLVCCRTSSDKLLFLIVMEDVLLQDVDVKVSVRFPEGTIRNWQ